MYEFLLSRLSFVDKPRKTDIDRLHGSTKITWSYVTADSNVLVRDTSRAAGYCGGRCTVTVITAVVMYPAEPSCFL